jgi:hypothetical protein
MPKTKPETFPCWLKTFENSGRGRDALSRLDKEFPENKADEPDSVFGSSLRNTVLRACFCAAQLSPKTDPDERSRRANWAALKKLRTQQKAIKRVRHFFVNHPTAAMFAMVHAYVDLRRDGIEISAMNDKYRHITARLDRVLAALEARLTEPRSFVACGPYRDENSYGCLVYDHPLDIAKRKAMLNAEQKPSSGGRFRNKPPGAKTVLLFDLVQCFRLSSQGNHFRQYRERMPEAGHSHYALAAALLSATFRAPMNSKDAAKRLEKFLENNQKSVGYCGWPILREWKERLREMRDWGP